MTRFTGPPRRLTNPTRPSRAQRDLELATNLLRRPGATLALTYVGGSRFSRTVGPSRRRLPPS
jgi:hypothetical protein